MAKKKTITKPVKKAAAKKPVKKAVAKTPSKSVKPAKAADKKAKPAAKKPVKKAAPAKPAKAKAKAVAKQAAKKASKPVKKTVKPAAKKAAVKKAPATKPVKKAAPKPSKAVKPATSKAVAKPVKKTPEKVAVKQAAQVKTPKIEAKPEAAPKPRVRGKAKQEETQTTQAPARPLVTQGKRPSMPRVTPMVAVQVSTLEAGNKERYSDQELEEFRAIINAKLDEARKDYELLKQTLANTDNNGTEDTSPSFKMIEDGSETLGREETAQLASRQEKFIKHLEDALLRIRNKTYGICRITGKLISKERLRLVPHATLSIEAKQQMSN